MASTNQGTLDDLAFGDAMAQMRPTLVGIARLQLRNQAWAEDAVSEALIAAYEGRAKFAQQAQLRTWVVGILKHKIIDQFRRSDRERSITMQDSDEDPDEVLDTLYRHNGHRVHAPSDWGDPEASLERSEFFAVLQLCLERLPDTLGRIFLMREWLELETAQICKELNISSTNCFVMLHRARLRLRECLEIEWFAGSKEAR